ncbi:MAG TPA: M23 family metallopeptidase [Gemmatimonadaceae bacterium]|nr:M23 family metallopeptidase [Gemmatimonadaceae bacterium]
MPSPLPDSSGRALRGSGRTRAVGGPTVDPRVTPISSRLRALPPPSLKKRMGGWTLLLIPPSISDTVRTYAVPRWSIRALVMLALGTLGTAGFLGMAFGSRMYEGQLTMMSEQLALTDMRLGAMGDTLRALRIIDFERTLAAAEALNRAAALPKSDKGAVLPVIGRLSSRFSYSRRHPILRIRRPHLGVDVSAPKGTPITAPASGVVRKVERNFTYGLLIELDHGDGVVTRYAHCESVEVEEGQQVIAGTTIATVGSSGLSTAPHLHYEVHVRGRPVDPLTFVVERPATPATTDAHPTRLAPTAPTRIPSHASE